MYHTFLILCVFYSLADEYDQHADEALVDAESYLANPVNAYRLCKKFTTELPAVKELLKSEPLIIGMFMIIRQKGTNFLCPKLFIKKFIYVSVHLSTVVAWINGKVC